MDELGANVRKFRLMRGLSKETLAKAVAYANATMIDQIEKGLKRPSYEQLQALAKALGVTTSDLVGDKAPCGVTNHANGDHAIGYQHNEGSVLMTDELQTVVREVVREELKMSRELLMRDFEAALRKAAREADGEPGHGENH